MKSGHPNSIGKIASRRPRRRTFRAALPLYLLVLFCCVAPVFPAHAYTFIANPPYLWPNGNVSMVLKLGNAGRSLIDGNTSWDTVAGQALSTWNSYLGTIQFSSTAQSPGVGSDGDHVNQAFFNSTIYGQSFGSGVLAVTTGWHMGTTRTEADVTFNTAISWDSYRGPLRFPGGQLLCDLRRVALHEFGHVVGLSHPDQAGQTVNAIMNSIISDLDALQSDDITGAEALYPSQAPTITTQPQSQTVKAGNSTTFAVTASGTAPLSYQWLMNNAPLAGATGASYTITAAQPSDAATYKVRVTNSGGVVDSADATLTVQFAPVIVAQPQSQTANPGANVTLSAVANGIPAPTYQWKLSGLDVPGATASVYTRNNVQPTDAGNYTVVASNSAGSTTSRIAILTVNSPPTVRLTGPTNGETFVAPASITVTASASDTDGNITRVDFYQDTKLLGTATASPFNLAWNSVAAGSYSLTATATDNLGATATSGPVSVRINSPTVCVPAPDGLVSWWPGDGSADDIAGNNSGVVFGRTAFVAGKVGRAFSFDGIDGYVIRTNAVATAAVDNWAMAAWVFWKSVVGTAGKEGQTLLYNGNQGSNGYGIIIPEQSLCSSDSRLCPEIGKLVVVYGGVSYIPTGVTLDQNAWNHVALVRENGALKLYKNGMLVFSNTTVDPNPPSAADGYMTIGTTTGYAFNGLVDEVMFFNTAATSDQVRALYAAADLGVCKPLKFDGLTPVADRAVILNLSGQAGKNLTIYSSPDLRNWFPIVTAPNPQGTLQFTNTTPSGIQSLFYKATAE